MIILEVTTLLRLDERPRPWEGLPVLSYKPGQKSKDMGIISTILSLIHGNMISGQTLKLPTKYLFL